MLLNLHGIKNLEWNFEKKTKSIAIVTLGKVLESLKHL